jgi:hypothetical protein
VTSYVQLDQSFLNTTRQSLATQDAFIRQDSKRYQLNLIGIANDTASPVSSWSTSAKSSSMAL